MTFRWRFGLAALRCFWRLWVGAFLLVALVTAAAVACSIVVRSAGAQPTNRETETLLSMIGFNIASISVVGSVMLRGLVVQVIVQLQHEMARWMLVGLLPGQVRGVVALQTLASSLMGVFVGSPVGIALAALLIRLVLGSSADNVPLKLDVPGFLIPSLAVLSCIGLAMLGPWRAATRVDPAIAVRDQPSDEGGRTGWLRVSFAMAILTGLALGLWIAQGSGHVDAVATTLFGETLVIVLVVALLAPWLVRAAHLAWTGLIMLALHHLPGGAPTWWLARAATGHQSHRVTSVAVPIAVVALLPGGIALIANSLRASQLASTGVTQASGASAQEILALCALPSLIALAGGALALFMASARRDRELALTALVGATPAQQAGQACIEAISLAVTGLLIGAAGLTAVSATTIAMLSGLFDHVVLEIPVAIVLVCAVTTALLAVAASLAPTVTMVRRPPHRIHVGID